jgi:biopolymer transport protein ExbB/TolQ
MAKRNSLADQLERRARRAIFWHALLRWESAVMIALTMVVPVFLKLAGSPWLWALIALGVGVFLEVIIFISSLTDEEDNARVVAAMFHEEHNPQQLRSIKLQRQLGKALEYQGLIANAIRRTQQGVLRDRLARAAEPVQDWIKAVHLLAIRLDGYEMNQTISNDLRSVPRAIEGFKKRLAEEDNPAVQATLRNTIADKERQWEYLQKLQNTMERAEYQLESTLAALGTIYAQLQTIDLQETERGRADRLRQEINEQVAQLQDVSEAMDEVYRAQ